jgi:hypothetical protein
MPDINEEMRLTADFAISTAKERYGLVLDYSEESLNILDDILEKIYWGFSSHAKEESEGGLIFNTAIIWGSYLGEYMRLKWGGTWLLSGSERRVSITSIEFSPISFVFQRITNHPEYRVTNYVLETKNVIYTSVIHPKKSQYVAESAGQPTKKPTAKLPKTPIKVDRRLIYITGGILGLLFIATMCVVGYTLISSHGLPVIGNITAPTHTSSITPLPTIMDTPTIDFTDTPAPTITELPTYTSRPTSTLFPSPTLQPTYTEIPSETPTETPLPTFTDTPRRTPTPTTKPTQPPTQPPKPPTPTKTQPPPPTNPPPPEIVSCSVNPSSVPSNQDTSLTFAVHFSTTGYSMNVSKFVPSPPGAKGCSASADGTTARCTGSSGFVQPGQSINVEIQTPLGSCSVGYGAP